MDDADSPNDWLSAQEVADALGLSLHVACSSIRSGEVPGVLRSRRPMRVSRAVFYGWLRGRAA